MENKKDLSFWNFSEKVKEFEGLPQNKLLKKREIDMIFENLHDRIKKFENNPCYNYLDGFYNFLNKTKNSKNYSELQINYENSKKSLDLFRFCLVLSENEESDKINSSSF